MLFTSFIVAVSAEKNDRSIPRILVRPALGRNRVFARRGVFREISRMLCYTALDVHPPHQHHRLQRPGSLALA
jgi:hypothetical protein